MNRRIRTTLGVALAAALVTTAAPAPAAAAHDRRPTVIALPDGFQPEGVAAAGRYAWFGSRATGEIYRADLITGAGRQVSPATGTPSLGLKVDPRGRLFVAGGTAGDARVIDTRTGAVLARYRFAEAPRRRRSSTTSRSPVTPPGSPTRTGRCSTACRWDAAASCRPPAASPRSR
ncbi:hypothetical protein NMK34_16600 [Micromonospora sp. BRA006-A]|uniref:hypothetical protein n=1 Tax=Micromonospora sp. BRA006-A TaxID=2962860 RepID=UPI00296FCB00|nr:hypothetical protein [Micromonospora sp. BRA006-A]MDW3848227.1 hypothetical protein [Micromonospora sp. BRA006-A]